MKTHPVVIVIIIIGVLCTMTGTAYAQEGSAGGFTRLGFGARGQGMGNALSTAISGTISPYYNPALSAFQEGHILYGSYAFLSLDRKFNQVSYTQNIRIYDKEAMHYEAEPGVQSISGISMGWINAGDATIQGYDNDGRPTEQLSVFENQFYVNFGTRFTDRLAVGFNAKFYYSGLYEGVTSSGFGVDFGLLYQLTSSFRVALVAQELLTKYKWDTSDLYGPQRGNSTEDPFVRIFRAAVCYAFPRDAGFIAAEVEMIGGEAFLGRAGAEIPIAKQLTLRGGLERIDLSDKKIDPRPAFGFSLTQPVAQLEPVIHYAFILEPVAPSPTHVLSFAVSF